MKTRALVLLLLPVFSSLAMAQKTQAPPTAVEWQEMQGRLRIQQQATDRLAKEVKALKRQQEDLLARFPKETQRLDQRIQEVGSTADRSTLRLGTLESRVGTRLLVLMICLGAVALGAIGMFFVLRNRNEGLDRRIQESRKVLDLETVKLDGKLVELLGNQIRLSELAVSSNSKEASNPSGEIRDHTFALRVGEEVQRMRQRLASLPAETKGLKPLLKSLERLEEDFTSQGYELVDLLNKPYTEEMNVKARFIPSDNLNAGERVITRVIKPPILFKGELLELPEVEVSIGG